MRSKLVSSGFRLLLLAFLCFIIFLGDRVGVTFTYPHQGLYDNVYVRMAKSVLLLLIVIELLRVWYYGIIKNPTPPRLLTPITAFLVPTVLVLVLLEIGFMFIGQSHEGNIPLASTIWFERYWKPMTADNYRDEPKQDTTGKRKILVVGDSFTAGHGLKSVDDRYGNVLAQKLGPSYTVYNLGISGSDTRDEYARLTKFAVKPDVLVLQYFPNDIERVAADFGLKPAAFRPYSDLPHPLVSLFMRSYLFNYLYWQFPHGNFAPFDEYARKAYFTPSIINTHLQDLNQFITYGQQRHIPLYLVVFPFSHNLEKTASYTKPIVALFRQNKVPVLEVGSIIGDMPPADRVVGRNDGHASVEVNRRVGEALFQLIKNTK